METVYLTYGHTNAAVRKFLKETFPNLKITVKQRKYQGMTGMTITVGNADMVPVVQARVDRMMGLKGDVRLRADFWDVVN